MKYLVKCQYCGTEYFTTSEQDLKCDSCGAANGVNDIIRTVNEHAAGQGTGTYRNSMHFGNMSGASTDSMNTIVREVMPTVQETLTNMGRFTILQMKKLLLGLAALILITICFLFVSYLMFVR